MTVSKTFETLENSAVTMSVTVDKADVQDAYNGMLMEYSKSVQLPGFRKGKVPTNVLERKFGDQLKIEALGRVMDQAVEAALEGAEYQPLNYGQPKLEGQPELVLGQDLSFAITFDVFPEVTVGDISGGEIEIPVCTIAKADEERELNEIRERNAIVMDKPADSKAAKGDVATVNYLELDQDGQVVPNSERQDFVFEIGSGYNLYKFDDELLGMKVGEEKSFEKSFPADYEYSDLAGSTKKLRVSLTKLKEKQLPKLDDDLAQDVSEAFKTLDDLKADVRSKLEKRLEDQLKILREKAIIELLLEKSTMSLPESMIRAEMDGRMRNLMERMGINDFQKFSEILTMSGKSLEDLYTDWRPETEKAIRTRLVLDKLIADSQYEVSDDELGVEYAKMAEGSSMSAEQIKEEYERRQAVDYLRDRIKEDRLLADLSGTLKQKKGKKLAFVDLVNENK